MTDNTTTMTFIDFISKGGWVMTPLLLCSVVALAVVFERLIWGPRRSRVIPAGLVEEILELVHANRFEEAQIAARAKSSPAARIMLTALLNSDKPKKEIIDVLEITGKKESLVLNRYLSVLAIIASITPLLGLLGTVFGIMQTFHVIGQMGLGNSQQLAAGIGEALITTATGLCIAIPTLVFYRYFLSQTRNLIVDMEELALRIVEAIFSSKKESNVSVLENKRSSRSEASIL